MESVGSTIRRTLGASLVVALLVAAMAFYRTAPDQPSQSAPSQSPTSSADTNELPSGPGTTEPGILLVAAPGASGSVDVSEVVLLSSPRSTIDMRPPDLARAGGAFTGTTPFASMVQITAHDQPVVLPGGRVDRPISVDLDQPARRFEIRYVLNDAVVRSQPSTVGRALAGIMPLTAGVPGDLPVAIAITGDAVRNLTCPSLEFAQRTCATGALPRLRVNVNLPRSEALAIVQLDLVRP